MEREVLGRREFLAGVGAFFMVAGTAAMALASFGECGRQQEENRKSKPERQPTLPRQKPLKPLPRK